MKKNRKNSLVVVGGYVLTVGRVLPGVLHNLFASKQIFIQPP